MANGKAMADMLGDVRATAQAARETNDPQLVQIADRLVAAADALEEATGWMVETMKADRDKGLASATAYLKLAGDVIGGHFLTRGAVAARTEGGTMRGRMTALAGFFAETALAEAPGRVSGITRGGDSFLSESEALFGLA